MRFENWPEQLFAYVDDATNKPFKWGEHDCMLFAAGAVEAMTGLDPLASVRGKYATARQAKKLLNEHGGMEKLLSAHQSKIPELMAQRGDIVLIDLPDMPALGVCMGRNIACAGPQGLTWLSMTRAISAWRV